jgi:hypothetical protein
MTIYRPPVFTYPGTSSPILDSFIVILGGPRGETNFGYVVGGAIVDAGAFTQLTGAAIGAIAEPYHSPGLARDVAKGLAPYART